MKESTVVNTQVTVGLIKLLKKIREELQVREEAKPRKRKRITKKEVCQELVKRCLIKKVV